MRAAAGPEPAPLAAWTRSCSWRAQIALYYAGMPATAPADMFAAPSTITDADYVLDEGRWRIHAGPDRLVLVEERDTHGELLRILHLETSAALLDALAHRLLDIIGVASAQPHPPWPSHPPRHRSETTLALFDVAAAASSTYDDAQRKPGHGLIMSVRASTQDQPVHIGLCLDAARYLLFLLKPPAQRW